jgi:hypothetical protein
MVERIRWAQILFDQAEVGLKNRRFTLGSDASALFEKDASPEAVARRLVSVFDADMPEARMANLVRAARSTSGANEVASAVTRLIFAAPEFQFC